MMLTAADKKRVKNGVKPEKWFSGFDLEYLNDGRSFAANILRLTCHLANTQSCRDYFQNSTSNLDVSSGRWPGRSCSFAAVRLSLSSRTGIYLVGVNTRILNFLVRFTVQSVQAVGFIHAPQ